MIALLAGAAHALTLEQRVDALEAIGMSPPTLLWSGRLASGSPVARDLFDNSTLTWAEWDPDTVSTLVEDSRGMVLDNGVTSGYTHAILAAPSGDFVATIAVTRGVSDNWAGLVSTHWGIADDVVAAPTTANWASIRAQGVSDELEVWSCSDYNSCDASRDAETDGWTFPADVEETIYLQVCVDSEVTAQFCASTNGQLWSCSAAISWVNTTLDGPANYLSLSLGSGGAGGIAAILYREDDGACPVSIGAFDN